MNTFTRALASLALAVAASVGSLAVQASASDIEFAPTSSSGHDFNHAPVGQTFVAVASQVKAGLYLADETSFTNWLAALYPGQILPGSYPYPVAASISVNVKLLKGEGSGGEVLDSRDVVLTAPFMGYLDVDYAAAGITLTPGERYTLLVSDASNQAYPNGVVGWVVPSVFSSTDFYNDQPLGAYAEGRPILQDALVDIDVGIGDNAFHVVSTGGSEQSLAVACTGANAVITSVGRDFLVVNGGAALADHVWYAPQNATTFTGGTTTFLTGELINYTGVLDSVAGCYADTMTVMPAPAPVLISGTLANGVVGKVYSASLTASGGVSPYTWSATGVPSGLSFANGVLSGTPRKAGTFSLAVTVTDSLGAKVTTTYTVKINKRS